MADIYVEGLPTESHIQHSIYFFGENSKNANDGYNTWLDWHLLPTSRPVVAPRKLRSEYITVPGRDGALDFSSADGKYAGKGKPNSDNSTGTWEFIVLHEFHTSKLWTELYSEILNSIHGKMLRIALLDAKNYYYTGRITVDSWKSEPDWSKITFGYSIKPGRTKFSDPSYKPKG